MAATGKTPILLYGSTTATNSPVAGNLINSSDGCEIAINVADKNLFFKDSTNVVNTVPIRQSSASSNGWLSSTDWSTFNGKQAALVSGTNIKTVGGTSLLGSGDLGVIGTGYGGTGLTAFTANGIVYASSTSALATGTNWKYDGTNVTLTGGNFVVGTSGKGIDFSATAGTGTSELLADYEEGTWTPTITFGGGSTGITYSNQYGYYTKIGRLVTISCFLELSNKGSSTGAALIENLPYTVYYNYANYGAAAITGERITYTGQKSAYGAIGTAKLYLLNESSGNALTQLTDTAFVNNSNIFFSYSYVV